MSKKIVALDNGGVVAARHTPEHNKMWNGDGLYDIVPVEYAFDGTAELVEKLGPENIFMVPKATEPDRLWSWWDYTRFFEITGVLKANVRLVKKRKDKLAVMREIGATHQVDNRKEILCQCASVVRYPYLFMGIDDEFRCIKKTEGRLITVNKWPDLVTRILSSRV